MQVVRTVAAVAVGALLVGMLGVSPATAVPGTAPQSWVDDTISVAKDDEGLSNADVAVRLTEATFAAADAVLIARDDAFADALASGSLQADSPLLLVSSQGPLPATVRASITDLGAGRAVVLGGEAAVGPAVVTELQQMGLAVERRAGPSRIETAVAVSHDLPEARTAIVARAFAAEGATPTQAFADAMAAGGLAAEQRLPILLSASDSLSPVTRDRLVEAAITDVLLVGGTAALSEGVAQGIRDLGIDVERIAGADRFETAAQIAKARDADSAADVERVVLVEGTGDQAWAGGFAAAAHSAVFDAPILLATDEEVPPATRQWFTGPPFAQDEFAQAGDVPLTCVVGRVGCEEGRLLLGLPARASVTYDPAGGPLPTGTSVAIAVDGAVGDVVVSGSCVWAPVVLPATGGAVVRDAGDGACSLTLQLTLPDGAVQREGLRYVGVPSDPRLLAAGACDGFRNAQLSADGTTAVVVAIPGRGCEGIASGPALVFVDVATGALTPVPYPAGYDTTQAEHAPGISPDGAWAVVPIADSRDVNRHDVALAQRATGRAVALREHNRQLADPSLTVIAGGDHAFRDDGRLIGAFGNCFYGLAGCYSAMEPTDGSLHDQGYWCGKWWVNDPDASVCDLHDYAPAGTTGIVFGGYREGSGFVEVRYDIATEATTHIDNGCDSGLSTMTTIPSGEVVYRACRVLTPQNTTLGGIQVTDFRTGQVSTVLQHDAADAFVEVAIGRIDPSGRYLPMLLADTEWAGRGLVYDLQSGQHVELGHVRGVPQLSAPAGLVIVATDQGLMRLPAAVG